MYGNDSSELQTRPRITITTPTKTVSVEPTHVANATRYVVLVIDIPRIVGDDSWKGTVTVTIYLVTYCKTSAYGTRSIQVDSIVLIDAADKTIYLPKPQTSLALELKTVAIDEEAEANTYLAVSVLSGHTKTMPDIMDVTIYYTVGTVVGSMTLTPAKTYSDHYEAGAYDTSGYLTAISSVVLELQAGTVERLSKYTIALVEMDSEWKVTKLIELLVDIHEYPLVEHDIVLQGSSPLDLWYTREYYHRTLSSLWLSPYASVYEGDLSWLTGSHELYLYDPKTGSLVGYLSVEFPSLATKTAYIPPDYWYDTYGTYLIGSEHLYLEALPGSLVSYYLYLHASVVGALASVDGIL